MKRRTFIAGLGSAVAWPVMARGQQRALPVIGYLSGGTESSDQNYLMAFRQGLGEHGYFVGRNVEVYIDHRKQCTIACRVWQTIWFVAGSQ
jgi:putative tryptophan/tyrosine transport system substrate-binding protein